MLQIELTEGDCVNGSAGCKMGEAVAGSLGPGEARCEACLLALPCSLSGRHVPVSHRHCRPRVSDRSGPQEGLGQELCACRWGSPGSSLCGAPLQGGSRGGRAPAHRWPPGLLRSENTAKGRRQRLEARDIVQWPREGAEEPRGWWECGSLGRGQTQAACARGPVVALGPAFTRITTRLRVGVVSPERAEKRLRGVTHHRHAPAAPGAPCGARTRILTLGPEGSW